MVKRSKVQKIKFMASLDQKQQTAILLTAPLGTLGFFFTFVASDKGEIKFLLVLRAESKSSETKFEYRVHHATANLTGVNQFF